MIVMSTKINCNTFPTHNVPYPGFGRKPGFRSLSRIAPRIQSITPGNNLLNWDTVQIALHSFSDKGVNQWVQSGTGICFCITPLSTG
jgi:hypothetical protein